MHFSTTLSLFTALSFASAAAIPSTLTSGILSEDDIIVWGANGRIEVMNKSSYTLLASQSRPAFNLTSSTPTSFNATNNPSTTNFSLSSRTISARCSKETIFTINPVSTFLNWDVPMSSVLLAGSSGTTTVAVTEGYSISNSVSVGVSSQLTLVDDFLSTTFSISYTETWTSTYSASYSFQIPAGKYGAVVSNPATTRHSGRVDIGCIADAGVETTYFTADSYNSKAYGGLSWVEGTISLCTGDTYPLPRCIGEGTLS